MVAFVTSFVLLVAMTVFAFLVVGRRRPIGTPLTWAEAVIAAVYVFAMIVLAYGIVPNQFLQWASNELGWRADALGIPTPWGTIFKDGITFFGRGQILVTKQAVRDIIVTTMYIVFLLAHIILWTQWQKRGKGKAEQPAIETSTFGRPLVRKV